MKPAQIDEGRRTIIAAGAALSLLVAIGACGDTTSSTLGDRPIVTFAATDGRIDVPAQVPAGYVDVHLVTAPGGDGHHIFVARLNDGVTLDEALNGDDDAFFTKMTLKGGNGTIAAGEDVTMTLELEPGNYFVLDNPQNEESPSAPFTVVASNEPAKRPKAKGIVAMGPDMVLDVPGDFDASGTWEFVNDDETLVHEAALVRLAAGKTAADLVAWAQTFDGPPPIDGELGSMGALGPGQRAWITIEPGGPGNYALVCFVPGPDGVPHVMKGMVAPVTVEG